MEITLLGLVVALLGIWCQFGGYGRTVLTMFGLVVFGAASAVNLSALGGASITPANFFLVFYLLRLVSTRGGIGALLAEIGPRRPLFIFLLLVLWIVGSALILPRLFEGATDVFSLARTGDDDRGTVTLRPTSGNVSQAVYAVGGFLVACATSAYARRKDGSRTVLSAIVLVTTLDLVFAFIDVITGATHTTFLLDPIHNASYALLTDDELGGIKRIAGSFTEASGFASFSLTLLGTNVALYVQNVRPRFTGPASVLLTGFVALSTSSAGYLGLAVFFGLFALYAVVEALVRHRARPLKVALAGLAAGTFLVSLVVLFVPAVTKIATSVINDSLLSKGTSDSAIERGSWNSQAWQVFLDTHGLGAGIGSTRGSDYVLVLLSNLGAIGLGLFLVLVLRVTLARLSPALDARQRGVVWAARVGLATTLVPAVVVGTVYDLGALFYALVGIAASGCATAPAVRKVSSSGPLPSNASFRAGA